MMRKLRPELNTINLHDIDELYLQMLLNEAAKKYSKSTLKKMRIIFKNAYDRAIHNHFCDNNPALELTLPEASEKNVRALTRDEERIVIEAAKEDKLGHIAIFMLDTGLRACEVVSLAGSDYDSHKKEVFIRISKSKNGVRVVPLIEEAEHIIHSQPHYCDSIFVSTRKTPITKTVLRRLYNRLRKKQ